MPALPFEPALVADWPVGFDEVESS